MVQTDVCKEKTLQYQLLGQIHRDASGKWLNIWAVVPFWLQRWSVLVLLAWLDEPIRFPGLVQWNIWPRKSISRFAKRMVSQKIHFATSPLNCWWIPQFPWITTMQVPFPHVLLRGMLCLRLQRFPGWGSAAARHRGSPRRAVSVKKRAEQGQKPPVNGQ